MAAVNYTTAQGNDEKFGHASSRSTIKACRILTMLWHWARRSRRPTEEPRLARLVSSWQLRAISGMV